MLGAACCLCPSKPSRAQRGSFLTRVARVLPDPAPRRDRPLHVSCNTVEAKKVWYSAGVFEPVINFNFAIFRLEIHKSFNQALEIISLMTAPKSTIRSLRLPRLRANDSHPAQERLETDQETSEECDALLTPDLPPGWSLNNQNEILNEKGLVMVDIQEELVSDPDPKLDDTVFGSKGTVADGVVLGPCHQLPKSVSDLLDELELEEIEEQKSRPPHSALDEQSDDEDLTKLDELDAELEENFKDQDDVVEVLNRLDQEKEELKHWGRNGLEGLKNAFKPNPKPNSRLEPQTDLKPASSSSSPRPPVSVPEHSDEPDPAPIASSSKSCKPAKKKTVSFAPEIDSSRSPSPSSPPSPSAQNESSKSCGIMLADIIEHPIEVSRPSPDSLARPSINGKNAHLNPRLASLLPRSYVDSQHDPSSPLADSSHHHNPCVPLEDDYDEGLDGVYDSDDESSSLWSTHDDEDDGEWPPNDLDIQAALDLRQTALEYHTKRQSLGLGAGTGPLGGDHPPPNADDEPEWVPIDSRPKADGVPRQIPGSSRFKAGRLPTWEEPGATAPRQANIVDGKLFGAAPVLSGPAPVNGAAVYELPGRSQASTDIDEDLSPEEMELLQARLNILAMDEESRLAAEQAGTALMSWMEKARKGEVIFDDDDDEQPAASKTQAPVVPGIGRSDHPTSLDPQSKSCLAPRVVVERVFDQPPEIKTVLKKKACFPKPRTCESDLNPVSSSIINLSSSAGYTTSKSSADTPLDPA